MVNEGEHHFGYRLRLWQLKPAPAEQLDVWKIAGGGEHPQVYATRQKKSTPRSKETFVKQLQAWVLSSFPSLLLTCDNFSWSAARLSSVLLYKGHYLSWNLKEEHKVSDLVERKGKGHFPWA